MSKFAIGALIVLVLILVAFSARTLDRLGALEEKIGQLQKPAPSALSPMAGVAPAPREKTAPPASEKESVEPPVAPPPLKVEAAPAAPILFSRRVTTSNDGRATFEARATVPDLSEQQKVAIAGLEESRRKEELQLEGEHAVRRREVSRRYDALIRGYLTPLQQQRLDEIQRAAAPKPDGPVTREAQSYIQQDPAPYDLEVEWSGEWWPARTVSAQGDLTLIHYVGHGKEWHEWVPPERVRPHRR